MVHLRPASVDDLPRMDELDAYYGASKITGKDAQAERAVVHTWVRRSVAWANGQKPDESGRRRSGVPPHHRMGGTDRRRP